jgi:hypothetical protein
MPQRACISYDLSAGTGFAVAVSMAYSLLSPQLYLLAGSSGESLRVAHAVDHFSRLSPGEQRIARALYDAQLAGGSPLLAESRARLRSLDEIASMGRNGAGWSRVFKQLKMEGLIAEQTLGHVVARWTRHGGRPEGSHADYQRAAHE